MPELLLHMGNKATRLREAANAGDLEAVRKLVTMLQDGTEGQKEAAVRALWNLGVNTENKVSIAAAGAINPLVMLLQNGTDGQKEAAAGALRNLDVDPDTCGWTALMDVVEEGHVDAARNLEKQDIDTKELLVRHIQDGELDLVKRLLEQGASAAFLDSNGNSTLVILLQRDDDEEKLRPFAKLLLEHGAPPLRSNSQGESAKSIAGDKRFRKIKDLINEYAAKSRRQPEPEDPRWFISPDDIVKTGTKLGEGSFGVVYHAKWRYIDVVVKEITVVEMRQFLKEVNTWRELRHDNVVPFYGANHRREPFFIVSKYAAKGTLTQYLKDEKEQGRAAVWQKLKEVAAGLAYLHQQGIVHGDLKGNNVVVSDNGIAMLTDFGMSFFEDGSCSIKKRKDSLGAMAWRAPEFARLSTMTPTCTSDVYSLGMCIIEAVTGKAPWHECANEEIRSHLREGNIQADKPDELANAQWELVHKMIAVVPENRPSIDYVLSKLRVFAEEEQCPHFSE